MPVMEFFKRAGHRARLVRLLQHVRGNRPARRRHRARARAVRLSADHGTQRSYRDVILDHNRRPRNFGPLGAGRRQRRGTQPPVRRPPHRCGCKLDGRPHRGHPLRGPGLRDLHRLGLAHDRGGQGQDARRGARAVRPGAPPAHRRCGAPREDLGKLAALSGVREFPGARQVREPVLAHPRLGAAHRRPRAQLPAVSTE